MRSAATASCQHDIRSAKNECLMRGSHGRIQNPLLVHSFRRYSYQLLTHFFFCNGISGSRTPPILHFTSTWARMSRTKKVYKHMQHWNRYFQSTFCLQSTFLDPPVVHVFEDIDGNLRSPSLRRTGPVICPVLVRIHAVCPPVGTSGFRERRNDRVFLIPICLVTRTLALAARLAPVLTEKYERGFYSFQQIFLIGLDRHQSKAQDGGKGKL